MDQILIVTGHYGCGKTSFAVSAALEKRRQGEAVTLIDLDIVNPYFRSADFRDELEREGIRVIAPAYAGSNLDLPVLSAAVDAAILDGGWVILDVGGDDAGAVALGRYADKLRQRPHALLYLLNSCRYLTDTPESCVCSLREIEQASRLRVHGLINNTNLGPETTAELVRASLPFAEQTAELAGLPLWGTAVMPSLQESLSDLQGVIPLRRLVLPPWTERRE